MPIEVYESSDSSGGGGGGFNSTSTSGGNSDYSTNSGGGLNGEYDSSLQYGNHKRGIKLTTRFSEQGATDYRSNSNKTQGLTTMAVASQGSEYVSNGVHHGHSIWSSPPTGGYLGGRGGGYGEYSVGDDTHDPRMIPLVQMTRPSSTGGSASGSSSTTAFLYDMSTTSGSSGGGFSNLTGAPLLSYKVEQTSPEHSFADTCQSPIPVEETIKNSFFVQDQIDAILEVLIKNKNLQAMSHLLNSLPKEIEESENVRRARAALAYHESDYKLFYNIIEAKPFDQRHHRELQILYLNARYTEGAKIRGKSLGAVEKYRVRRKQPLPLTIWDGQSTSYTFKDIDRGILRSAYKLNKYPDGKTKKILEEQTSLNKRQIDNWFKNRRQRDRPKEEKDAAALKKKMKAEGQLVKSPAGSLGSCMSGGSGSITGDQQSISSYAHLPYGSPNLDDIMEVKYTPYGPPPPANSSPTNNASMTMTAAQMKSYANAMVGVVGDVNNHYSNHSLSISPLVGSMNKQNNNNSISKKKQNQSQSIIGASWGGCPPQKLTSGAKGRGGKKSAAAGRASSSLATAGFNAGDYYAYYGEAPPSPAASMIVHIGEAESPPPNGGSSWGGGATSGSWALNWQHHHPPHHHPLPPSHHSPHHNGDGNPHHHNILPSLAASFAHHSHHHHTMNINMENRISVQ